MLFESIFDLAWRKSQDEQILTQRREFLIEPESPERTVWFTGL
jgi:hypothetical protein